MQRPQPRQPTLMTATRRIALLLHHLHHRIHYKEYVLYPSATTNASLATMCFSAMAAVSPTECTGRSLWLSSSSLHPPSCLLFLRKETEKGGVYVYMCIYMAKWPASLLLRCPWLWYQLHPSVPILFGYLFVLSFVSMIKTSWTDPGVRKRKGGRREGILIVATVDHTSAFTWNTACHTGWIWPCVRTSINTPASSQASHHQRRTSPLEVL